MPPTPTSIAAASTSTLDAARAEAYRSFIETRIRLLASTCDPNFGAFAVGSVADRTVEPASATETVTANVKGKWLHMKGRARVTLRLPSDTPGAERKLILVSVSPPSVLPACIQQLFRARNKEAIARPKASCSMSGGRRMHSQLAAPSKATATECLEPVLKDVASAHLALVVTWSAVGAAAQNGHRELDAIAMMLQRRSSTIRVRAVLAGKGSRCSSAGGMPLPRWAAKGWAHCIEGPNVGAREAHTIWSFCDDFYHHLPRTVLFVQDDPQLATLLRDLQHGDWTTRLAESYAKRAAEAASAADPRALEPWLPDSCACAPVREAFDPRVHGYYRPMLWWMRTFLLPFANRSALLPTRLVWPATAQFAMPRAAISARSREFYDLHARLTEVPAPLKRNVARNPRASEAEHSTVAAAANAGPIVVDLGSDPPAGSGYADAHRVATGYDLAHTFERSWFAAFDPAFPEGRPAQPRCFEPDAIAQGPMRCTAAVSCPSSEAADGRHDGGCATTDQLGLTAAPPGWRYASERCLSAPHRMRSDGCIVKPHRKSAAWVQEAL